MKIAATIFSVFLLLLGSVFILSAFHPEAAAQGKVIARLAAGAVPVAGAILLLYFAWRGGSAGRTAPGSQEAPGQLSLKPVTCPHCGGQVDASSARFGEEGTLSMTCEYCKGVFLVQEDPKW